MGVDLGASFARNVSVNNAMLQQNERAADPTGIHAVAIFKHPVNRIAELANQVWEQCPADQVVADPNPLVTIVGCGETQFKCTYNFDNKQLKTNQEQNPWQFFKGFFNSQENAALTEKEVPLRMECEAESSCGNKYGLRLFEDKLEEWYFDKIANTYQRSVCLFEENVCSINDQHLLKDFLLAKVPTSAEKNVMTAAQVVVPALFAATAAFMAKREFNIASKINNQSVLPLKVQPEQIVAPKESTIGYYAKGVGYTLFAGLFAAMAYKGYQN